MGFIDWTTVRDVAIILIPVLIAIILTWKFVVPKRPVLGIGLALGAGLLGAFFVNRRLKKAFDAEKTIAEHNEMMAKFKEKQKQRFETVMANKKVIEELEKQKKKLEKKGEKYATEVELLNKEIEERTELNKKVLADSDEFLKSIEERRTSIDDLLKRYEADGAVSSTHETEPEIPNRGTPDNPDIEVDGFRLLEG
ncbi:MAG TPA: hypothetical protein ENK44_13770 [Caldithrix abyssi]|uniref:Uncharacterized protein n=1 Tax=Caldithrix abyssi TaxID=187145 RepID=A0A7V4U4K9_CALAY|nr:hypothetical protein [Caldithrix abyssi]